MDFTEVRAGGYTSDPEDEGNKPKRDDGLDGRTSKRSFSAASKHLPPPPSSLTYMNAFERHKFFINQYVRHYASSTDQGKYAAARGKTDMDIIKQEHRFLWTEEDDQNLTWEKRLAKRYYDKLFKEYCIADLTRYKEGQVGMRWRTKQEVFDGKGQFVCGSKHCGSTEGLQSWEVNFAYVEHGDKKNALVKLRLCSECSVKLNHKHKRRLAKQVKRQKKELKRQLKRRRKEKKQEGGTESSEEEVKGKGVDGESEEEGEGNESGGEKSEDESSEEQERKEDNIWATKKEKDEEEVREEEFEDYFEGMFL